MNCGQTGLGKTFSTLTAAVHKIVDNIGRNLEFILIIPGSAMTPFVKEFENLNLPYNTYTATKIKTMVGARFHIFNYSSLPQGTVRGKGSGTNRFFETLKQIYFRNQNLFLIADEAHVLQDPSTIQYRFVREITPMFKGMWFLTATPILNGIEGLFHMTELLRPGFFGNIYRFRNKYQIREEVFRWEYDKIIKKKVKKRYTELVGFKNLDHLSQVFSEIAIIRSNDYNIEFDYRHTTLSETSESFYKLAADGLLSGKLKNNKPKTKTKAKKGKTELSPWGARLHDLQRVVSNSHKEFKQYSDDTVTEKEVLLFDTIKEVMDRGEAALVYFTYRETLDRIKYIMNIVKEHYNIDTVHEISGGVSKVIRDRVERTLTTNEVVLITSAGTESINLQQANNLVFYEIPFALREFIQACGRITRTDSTYNRFRVYVLEALNTIDTYKKNRIVANSPAISHVLSGSNILPTELLQISLDDVNAMRDELLWRR